MNSSLNVGPLTLYATRTKKSHCGLHSLPVPLDYFASSTNDCCRKGLGVLIFSTARSFWDVKVISGLVPEPERRLHGEDTGHLYRNTNLLYCKLSYC